MAWCSAATPQTLETCGVAAGGLHTGADAGKRLVSRILVLQLSSALSGINVPNMSATAISLGLTTHRAVLTQCRSVIPRQVRRAGVPLADEEGALFPELEAYYRRTAATRAADGTHSGSAWSKQAYSSGVCTAQGTRGPCAGWPWGPRRLLDACRHSGLTELGDAGATEYEGMAASMHKTPRALRLYVKHSEVQRRSAARKRRRLVEGA